MTTESARAARLEARISPEQKALIERAAAYEGRTVSDFVVHTVQQAAMAVIEEHEILRLNRIQSIEFVERLLQPTSPNDALKQAAREYYSRVASQ